jgi:hypothetical protein
MASKRKPASRSKIERLRQVTKSVKRDEAVRKPSDDRPILTDKQPGPILSAHFLDTPSEVILQPPSMSQPPAQQPAAMEPWYRRLFARFFAKRDRPKR